MIEVVRVGTIVNATFLVEFPRLAGTACRFQLYSATQVLRSWYKLLNILYTGISRQKSID